MRLISITLFLTFLVKMRSYENKKANRKSNITKLHEVSEVQKMTKHNIKDVNKKILNRLI